MAIPVEDLEWYETHTMLMNMSLDSSNELNDTLNDTLNETLNETLNDDTPPMGIHDVTESGARSVQSGELTLPAELTLPPDMDRLFDGPAPAPTPAIRVPDVMTNFAVESNVSIAPEKVTLNKTIPNDSEG